MELLKPNRSISLRTAVTVGVALLVLLTLGEAWSRLATAWGQRKDATEVVNTNRFVNALLLAGQNLVAERGRVNVMLHHPEGGTGGDRVYVSEHRQAVDRNVESALTDARTLGVDMGPLSEDIRRLRELRLKADADMARPARLRSDELADEWFRTTTKVAEEMVAVAAGRIGQMDRHTYMFRLFSRTRLTLFHLRATEGAIASRVASGVLSGVPMDAATREEIMHLRGIAEQSWKTLQGFQASLGSTAIDEKIKTLSVPLFDKLHRLQNEDLAAARAARPYPVPRAALAAASDEVMREIAQLSNLLSDETEAYARNNMANASRAVALHGGLALLATLLGAATLLILVRGLFAPLRDLENRLLALSRGDLSAEPSARYANNLEFRTIDAAAESLREALMERRHAEAEARITAARLAEAQDIGRLGSWDWDIAADRLEWSDVARRIFMPVANSGGYTEFRQTVHPDDRERVDRAIKSALTTDSPCDIEHRIAPDAGHIRAVHTRGRVFRDGKGHPVRMIGTVQDITGRRAAEEALHRYKNELEDIVDERTTELRHARDLAEAASKAKTAFLANMSHEIRTPLHAIMGMANLIRRSGTTPEQAERLGRIDAAANHLAGVINDILDFSKIEAGKVDLACVPISIKAIMDNIRSIVAEDAAAKKLELRTEVLSVPADLTGDAIRLKQALLNFAANAIKFTEAGIVTLRAMVEQETETDFLIRFEVNDKGIGIDPHVLPKLFSAFEQADNSTTRIYGGTGLGLAITKKIAELMGGTVGVQSAPGQGSTFWFTARLGKMAALQRKPAPTASESAESTLKRSHGQLRILVADDDPDNRDITRHLLKNVWPSIDTAEDGIAAVELASRNRYDLILMDMRMPRMDGLEATRRIREQPNGRDVLIMALTANVFPEDKIRCLEAGMDDVIPKATSAEAPFAAILKCLTARPSNRAPLPTPA